jgi:hypothetical protein
LPGGLLINGMEIPAALDIGELLPQAGMRKEDHALR